MALQLVKLPESTLVASLKDALKRANVKVIGLDTAAGTRPQALMATRLLWPAGTSGHRPGRGGA